MMIKIENVEVFGWEAAIRGMRNPLNSWDKSDSEYVAEEYKVGSADLALMQKLVLAGSDHSKFMRMINVTMDITAPRYWWTEFDTYKVGTVRNSCSTMHKITEKEFTVGDFSFNCVASTLPGTAIDNTVKCLNTLRTEYLKTNDEYYWYKLIQLLPQSYNQKATIQLSYAVLRSMYHARKNHKLVEWRNFCEGVKTLPYSELITCKNVAKSEVDERIKTIADHYGIENQIHKLNEELFELGTASAHYLKNGDKMVGAVDNLVEEMADALIMLQQIIYLTGTKAQFEQTIDYKLKRQIERIKEDKSGNFDEKYKQFIDELMEDKNNEIQ